MLRLPEHSAICPGVSRMWSRSSASRVLPAVRQGSLAATAWLWSFTLKSWGGYPQLQFTNCNLWLVSQYSAYILFSLHPHHRLASRDNPTLQYCSIKISHTFVHVNSTAVRRNSVKCAKSLICNEGNLGRRDGTNIVSISSTLILGRDTSSRIDSRGINYKFPGQEPLQSVSILDPGLLVSFHQSGLSCH